MLTIEGLNTHYGASHVLQGVDLTVPEGRICSVLGRNGVGKSTTLRTVMGLVPQVADASRSMARTSPPGRRIASRVPVLRMCRRAG